MIVSALSTKASVQKRNSAMDQAIYSVSWQTAPTRNGVHFSGTFLTHLAVNGHVSASTQNQALSFIQGGAGLVRMSGVYGLMANRLHGTGMHMLAG